MLKNPNACWTCEGQRLCVVAVLQGRTDVLSILATGSGKTMQVILPVLMQPMQTTIVVLPLKALISDYERRLQAMEISYQVWQTYSNNPHAVRTDVNLILVTIEQAQKAVFKEELLKAHQSRPIKRFVFDEVQTALLSENYRQSMRHIDELRHMLPVQFVLMSGTIPPAAMPALRDRFGVMPNAVEIRTKSVRPELQYILEPAHRNWGYGPLVLRAQQLVKHYTPQFQPQDRGLIYVETKKLNQLVVKELHIPCYEGGQSMTDQQRQEAYRKWTQGDSQWMTCTSAFGAGVDWATVRVVIFCGSPQRMSDMIQEADRGGRDGRHALVFVLAEPQTTYHPRDKDAVTAAHLGQNVMFDWIYKSKPGREGCLRYQLSHYNDGVGTACTDLEQAAFCSHCSPPTRGPLPLLTRKQYVYKRPLIEALLCQKRSAGAVEEPTIEEHHKLIKRKRATRIDSVQQQAQALEHALNERLHMCHVCLFQPTEQPDIHHDLLHCPCFPPDKEMYYRQFRSLITFPKYNTSRGNFTNVCFYCGVPQIGELHATFGRGSCRWDDQIFVLAWITWFEPEERQRLQTEEGLRWNNMEEYVQWLLQPCPFGTYKIHHLYMAWIERSHK